MSYTISTSEKAEDVWMLRNALFRWFASLVRMRYASEADIVSEIATAEAVHGIALDGLRTKDRKLEERVRASLIDVAEEIIQGKHSLPEIANDVISKQDIHRSFTELLFILRR